MTDQKRPLKVFLCHASTDKPKVRELYRYLRRRGIQPWFDEEHLVGGQDWQVEIPKALATSDAIIICLTKNSVDKEGYIQKEIKFALDKALEMPEGRIFLIPVKFEECEVPFTLSRYQWVDLTIESGYAKMMKALKFRASQLERSTVEVSKKDVEEENLARQKKERESAEKEAAEKTRLEVEEQERQKSAKEKAERETAEREKVAKEKEEVEKEIKRRLEKNIKKAKRDLWWGKLKIEIKYRLEILRIYRVPIMFLFVALAFIVPLAIDMPKNISEAPRSSAVFPVTDTISPTTNNVLKSATPTTTSTLTLAAIQTPTPTSLPTEITDAKGVTMRLVPAGEFTMGRNENKLDAITLDEQPVHLVSLNSYYIDKFEVTNSLYSICVDAGVCLQPTNKTFYTNPARKDHPVVYVNWYMAWDYCEWRGARLPTEAEWEKAAKGIDSRTFPWGESFSCQYGNFLYGGEPCVGDTTIVGAYNDGVSPYGLFDMAGNVWEWTSSLGLSYPYDVTDGRESVDGSGYRVLRGGSRNFDYSYVTTTTRYIRDPLDTVSQVGFRCVYYVAPPTILNEVMLKTPTPSITNTATVSPTHTPTPTATSAQSLALVRVYNRFNVSKDIYVDGQLITEALKPGQYIQTSLFFGIHDFYTCPVVTLRCDSGYENSFLIDVNTNPFTVNLGR
jgi:formylglycine-generating enzyme required for sulfatase activity